VAVRGESLDENGFSDWGILSRLNAGGALGDFKVHGEGGGRDIAGVAGDSSDFPTESAGLVVVDGRELGDRSLFSTKIFGKPPALTGLVNTGVRALRKSVYASGGVIGVALPSSRLMSLTVRVLESLCNSEGNMKGFGVLSGGRSGFWGGILRKEILEIGGKERNNKSEADCFK
jgi:hypothetical protein